MENIGRLMKELPEDYEIECFEQGAFTRARGIANPRDLMMLTMFHLHTGCSLMEISEVARLTDLGKVSDVAFMKRLAKCGGWFSSINAKIITEVLIDYQKPKWLADKSVVAVDASVVKAKGRNGKSYKLHYAFDIFTMSRVEHKITTNETGESLCNFTPQPNQLILADRAYANIKSINLCNKADANYIMRLGKRSFTIRDENGEKLDLLPQLLSLDNEECLDITAFATNLRGDSLPIRVCARRKTQEAMVQSHKKLKRRENKNQSKMADETKTFNEYIIVITNLHEVIPAEEILETYRLRWQIEIYFKRLKSILDYDTLPKRRQDSAIAWLNGKLMIALLIETIIAKASFFPKEHEKQEYMA